MITQISFAGKACTIAFVCEMRKAENRIILLRKFDRQEFTGKNCSACTTNRAHINMWF